MFTNRELATVLALLRLFQVTGSQDIDSLGVDPINPNPSMAMFIDWH